VINLRDYLQASFGNPRLIKLATGREDEIVLLDYEPLHIHADTVSLQVRTQVLYRGAPLYRDLGKHRHDIGEVEVDLVADSLDDWYIMVCRECITKMRRTPNPKNSLSVWAERNPLPKLTLAGN